MDLKSLRDEVLAHGFDGTQFGLSRITQYINDGMNLIARRVDWYGEEAVFDFPTVTGTSTYAWPTDLARGRSLHDTGRDIELEAVSLRDIDRSSNVQGTPNWYAVDGPNLHLYPVPDNVYNLELRYWKLPGQLVNDEDVPSLPNDWHWLLWNYACWKAYEAEDDPTMGQYWQGQFANGLSEFSADSKFPTTDYPTVVNGMWEQDRSLNSRGWGPWTWSV